MYYDDEELDFLHAVVNPYILATILELEEEFNSLNFNNHHTRVETCMNRRTIDDKDTVSELIKIYNESVKLVLEELGVTLADSDEDTLSLDKLKELLKGINDIVDTGNHDVLSTNLTEEKLEDGQLFLGDVIPSLTKLSTVEVISMVDDFEVTRLIPLYKERELIIPEEIIDICRMRRSKLKLFIQKHELVDTRAYKYVVSRDSNDLFNYDYGTAMMVLSDGLEEDYKSTKHIEGQLVFIAMASKLSDVDHPSAIYRAVDNLELTANEISDIRLKLDNIFKEVGYDGYN